MQIQLGVSSADEAAGSNYSGLDENEHQDMFRTTPTELCDSSTTQTLKSWINTFQAKLEFSRRLPLVERIRQCYSDPTRILAEHISIFQDPVNELCSNKLGVLKQWLRQYDRLERQATKTRSRRPYNTMLANLRENLRRHGRPPDASIVD